MMLISTGASPSTQPASTDSQVNHARSLPPPKSFALLHCRSQPLPSRNMSSSEHERVAADLLDDFLRHPEAASLLADTRRRLLDGQVSTEYLAVIGQIHPRAGAWPREQIASYLIVHANLMGGWFGQVKIDVGTEPARDVERQRNAAALADLPHPFQAWVDLEQNADPNGDGWLEWSETITIGKSTGDGIEQPDGSIQPRIVPHEIESGFTKGVPIEIGATKPSRTLGHLYGRYWGVARWPYGSRFITLLLNLDMFVPPGGQRRNPLGL